MLEKLNHIKLEVWIEDTQVYTRLTGLANLTKAESQTAIQVLCLQAISDSFWDAFKDRETDYTIRYQTMELFLETYTKLLSAEILRNWNFTEEELKKILAGVRGEVFENKEKDIEEIVENLKGKRNLFDKKE